MLAKLVQEALKHAREDSLRLSHAERSTKWVRAFANTLRSHSQMGEPGDSVVAFCRGDDANRFEFRVNELLFDILVATTKPIKAVKGKELRALSRTLWVVESELKRSDSRDILIDLNKLVVAKAVNKVLVVSASTPLVEWVQGVIADTLNPEESNIFLAVIPHPEDWHKLIKLEGEAFQLTSAGWLTTDSSRPGAPSAVA